MMCSRGVVAGLRHAVPRRGGTHIAPLDELFITCVSE
jgi:hypothetical protein